MHKFFEVYLYKSYIIRMLCSEILGRPEAFFFDGPKARQFAKLTKGRPCLVEKSIPGENPIFLKATLYDQL